MTALIIHESFVKQRQQTLPRCDPFTVTISFLFLFFVLTSSSIIFRKHTIWFLGDTKTCFLALPACRIKIKTCTSFNRSFSRSTLPAAFGFVRILTEWQRRYMWTREAEASNYRPISTFCVFVLCACVWMKRKTWQRIRVWAAVSNVTVVFERKQKTRIWVWSWGSVGSLMSTRPSKRIAGTCCHCTLQTLAGLRSRLLDQDDTCVLERTCFVASLLIFPSHNSSYGLLLRRPPAQQLFGFL